MWETVQVVGTLVGIVTGVGTLITWATRSKNRSNRVPSRQRPKGAWERVAAISSLTKISEDPYLEAMASAAARAAAEAEAFEVVERRVKFPLWMAAIYAALGGLAFWPSFNLGMLVVAVIGALIFLTLALRNLGLNEGDKISIHTLVEKDDELILRDPYAALKRHAKSGFEGNGYADARVVVLALRSRMRKIQDEKDALKQWGTELDERAKALKAQEQALRSRLRINES